MLLSGLRAGLSVSPPTIPSCSPKGRFGIFVPHMVIWISFTVRRAADTRNCFPTPSGLLRCHPVLVASLDDIIRSHVPKRPPVGEPQTPVRLAALCSQIGGRGAWQLCANRNSDTFRNGLGRHGTPVRRTGDSPQSPLTDSAQACSLHCDYLRRDQVRAVSGLRLHTEILFPRHRQPGRLGRTASGVRCCLPLGP